MKTLIIFHASCRDGFCAAFVLRHALLTQLKIPLADMEFHPAHYGTPAPDVVGKHVYIADFSYPLEVMRKIAETAESLTVFDHHRTAEASLRALDSEGLNCEIHFDLNRSGARLVWDYFHTEEPWWLVRYVEDRDLWRFALPNSKAVNAFVSVLPFEFDAWEAARVADTAESAAVMGGVVLAKIDQTVESALKGIRLIPFAGYEDVPVLNCTAEISETLHAVCNKTDAPFSVGWFQRGDGLFQYSLRSRGDFDVAELAKKFGGGGHRAAAGFESCLLPYGIK
jgi:uncharacterized protein